MAARLAAVLAVGLGVVTPAVPSFAADLGVGVALRPEGVPCESPVVQSFPSVWLGHFAGGRSFYPGPGAAVALDWRDEKLCFPSLRTCGRYIHVMRGVFHRPEGYFTCLPIR